METIKEAKQQLRIDYITPKGGTCPVCNQRVKLYKRKLNSVMARCLIKLHRMGPGYHHVSDIVKGISDTGTNDFSKLRYWNLISEQANTDNNKKNSGMWCITFSGQQFATYQTNAAEHCLIYNGEKQGFTESTTSIIQALGAKFNYQELMKGEL